MAKISKANSLRRLTLDLEELQRDPVPACSAYPVTDDWLEWHADLGTVEGPMAGVSIHVVLKFPADYPMNAPKFQFPVDALPSFRHPNLYFGSFCVDILDGSFGRSYQSAGQSGWTPAYTVRGLIQQLSTFIFHRADRGRGSEIRWSSQMVANVSREAEAFRCRCCRWNPTTAAHELRPLRWNPTTAALELRSVAPAAAVVQPVAAFDLPPAARAAAGELAQKLRLPTWFLLQTLEALDGPGLLVFGQVCRAWRRAAVRAQLLARRETRCYFTKHSAAEAVLGVGLTAQWHPDGNVQSVNVVLDVLSAEAFDQGVRRGAYGESFADFLPLALEPRHFHRARPRIETAIACIAMRQTTTVGTALRLSGVGTDFAPWMALTVLPAAMNAFVVQLMEQGTRYGSIARHASEKALWGYCSLHHLLLALAETYPELKALAACMVKDFVAAPENRTKVACPDLGQLLVLQTLAGEEPWDALAAPLLAEAMARNVMWVEREVGHHSLTRDGWFKQTLTSKRLLMFQAAFLRHTPAPADALATYAARFGQPTEAAQAALLTAARSILKVDSWAGFFAEFGLAAPLDLFFEASLGGFVDELTAASVQRSEECGYTGDRRRAARGSGGWKVRLQILAACLPAKTALAASRGEAALEGRPATAKASQRPAVEDTETTATARSAQVKRAFEARARRELIEEARSEALLLPRAAEGAPLSEDGWSVRGATQAVRRSERRGRELSERIAAIEAQAAWQERWGRAEQEAETCAEWLTRLGEQERLRPVLCRNFERDGRCTYPGCRFLHVPKKPTVPLVESRARELEQKAEQSLRQRPRKKGQSVEEASTAASDAGATVSEAGVTVSDVGATVSEAWLPTPAIPEEHVVNSEESAADVSVSTVLDESVALAKRRRALAKKLREIDVLAARGNLTQEEQAKVHRRGDLERELAALE